MIPDDHILWEAECQIAKTMTPAEHQEAVSTAKLWLIARTGKHVRFISQDGKVRVFCESGDGSGAEVEWDLDVAMLFILRAYRLNRGLTGGKGSALIGI